MIRGIGADICEISRFRKMPYNGHKSFYNKIFSKAEIDYCLSKAHPEQHFAARFSAKEAFIKAGGLKLKDLKKIEIVNKKNGQPQISYGGFGGRMLLSLSHTNNTALAVVILC